MAVDLQNAKGFIANKFGTTVEQLDSLSVIPGFNPELERGLKMFFIGMSGTGSGNRVNGGLEIMSNAITGASADPVAFVKSAMRDSVYNGNTDLLKKQSVYLQQNNIPVEDIKSLYTSYATQKANDDAAYAAAQQGGGGLFGDVGKFFASIDPSTAISRELTNLYQPVEKAITAGVEEVSKALSTDDAKKAMAIAAAYYLPGVGSALGQSLVTQGLITGAAIPYAAAIGTALASTGASVAQGVPFDTALTNATVNAVTSTGSQSVAGYISKLGASPEVANAVTSVGASGLATAAKGGSAADIERNMTGALAGSTITSMTGDRITGAAVGGQITGGTTGALLGAAGAAGSEAARPAGNATTSVSGVDPGVQVAGGDDASALNLASVSAKPEMLGKESEKSSQIYTSTDNEGITTYRRSITGTTPDGKPYSYTAIYDPDAPQGKQFAYETVSSGAPIVLASTGEMTDENPVGVVRSSYKRPDFTATDETKTGGTVAGEGLVVLGDKAATGGGSSVSPADQKVLDLIKPTTVTPQTATPVTFTPATPATFTPAIPQIFTPAIAIPAVPPAGETDAERTARIDAYIERTIAGEQDYYKKLMEGRGRGNVVVGSGADAGGGGNATSNVVIDTGPGGGNAAGNVIVSDGGLGGGNAAGNVVISDGGLGGGGGNAAGNVIVGPGNGGGGPGAGTGTGGPGTGLDDGTGPGPGDGTGTGDGTGLGEDVVVDEPPVDEDEPPVDEDEPPEDEDKPPEDEDKPPGEKEDEYKPDLFVYGGKTPKPRPRTRTDLGTTLQGPFAPSTTLGQALTGYRGAGEIEGKKTGKPRKNVWNEESLRLKDALGL